MATRDEFLQIRRQQNILATSFLTIGCRCVISSKIPSNGVARRLIGRVMVPSGTPRGGEEQRNAPASDDKIGGRTRQVKQPPARRGRTPVYTTAQQILRDLGRRVKAIREGQGISVAQLASRTNIAPQTIIHFEDEGRPIRFFVMHQIAESLGYDLEFLLKQRAG